MHEDPQRAQLSRAELFALAAGVALAVVPSLPFLDSDAELFVRFHNWALFVGGLLTGAVLTRARTRLDR